MAAIEKIPRTKLALQQAIHRLLMTTPLHDITITELCREAGIGRATFYRSYTQPVDILIEQHNELLLYIRERQKPGEVPDKALLVAELQDISDPPERRQICRNALANMSEEDRIYVSRPGLIHGIFLERMPKNTAQYFRFVIMVVLRVWLENGTETPEQIADRLISLAKATGDWEERK